MCSRSPNEHRTKPSRDLTSIVEVSRLFPLLPTAGLSPVCHSDLTLGKRREPRVEWRDVLFYRACMRCSEVTAGSADEGSVFCSPANDLTIGHPAKAHVLRLVFRKNAANVAQDDTFQAMPDETKYFFRIAEELSSIGCRMSIWARQPMLVCLRSRRRGLSCATPPHPPPPRSLH